MTIVYECVCGQPISAREEDAGKIRRCPACGMTGVVPDRGAPDPRRREPKANR